MKRRFIIPILCIWVTLPLLAQPQVGTWRLTSATYTNAEMKSETVDQHKVGELKIITPTHFMWMSYVPDSLHPDRRVFGGAGGGHYSLDGIKYVEKLEYASWKDYETNSTDFSLRVDGDKMYQMGALSNQSGEKTIIQEIWQRENLPAHDGKQIGTWHLASQTITNAKGEKSTTDMNRFRKVKIITPTHWMYIAQIMQNNENTFQEAAGGTYTLRGDTYQEQHAFNDTFKSEYTLKVEGDRLTLSGWQTNLKGEKYRFDEVYQREKEPTRKLAQRR